MIKTKVAFWSCKKAKCHPYAIAFSFLAEKRIRTHLRISISDVRVRQISKNFKWFTNKPFELEQIENAKMFVRTNAY